MNQTHLSRYYYTAWLYNIQSKRPSSSLPTTRMQPFLPDFTSVSRKVKQSSKQKIGIYNFTFRVVITKGGPNAGRPYVLQISGGFFRAAHYLQTCNYDVASDLWSASAVAWTWAAYCKFQRTSSKEGRDDGSRDMHLLVIDITIDNDSCEQVLKTTGSTIRLRPLWLPKDACSTCLQFLETYHFKQRGNM